MYTTVPGSTVAQLILVIVINCLLPTLLGFSLEVLSHAAVTHIFLFLISTTFKGWELAKKGGTIKPPCRYGLCPGPGVVWNDQRGCNTSQSLLHLDLNFEVGRYCFGKTFSWFPLLPYFEPFCPLRVSVPGILGQACSSSSGTISSLTFSESFLSLSSPDPLSALPFKYNSVFSSLINNL